MNESKTIEFKREYTDGIKKQWLHLRIQTAEQSKSEFRMME